MNIAVLLRTAAWRDHRRPTSCVYILVRIRTNNKMVRTASERLDQTYQGGASISYLSPSCRFHKNDKQTTPKVDNIPGINEPSSHKRGVSTHSQQPYKAPTKRQQATRRSTSWSGNKQPCQCTTRQPLPLPRPRTSQRGLQYRSEAALP